MIISKSLADHFFLMVMLIILRISVFQPVIHEPLSKPDHLLHQNGINGDLVENGGTSHEAPDHTRESQGNVIDENKRMIDFK